MKTKTALSKRATKFITEKLIPFMLREHGRGFAMDTWKSDLKKGGYSIGDSCEFDNILRPVPPCHTVACIGGSVQYLTSRRSQKNIREHLGLTKEEAYGLFHHWYPGHGYEYGWPEEFAGQYEHATTPAKKARVAVSLLKKLISKGADILRNPLH